MADMEAFWTSVLGPLPTRPEDIKMRLIDVRSDIQGDRVGA